MRNFNNYNQVTFPVKKYSDETVTVVSLSTVAAAQTLESLV